MLVYICQTNAFYVLVTGYLFLTDSSYRYWSFFFADFALQSFVEVPFMPCRNIYQKKPFEHELISVFKLKDFGVAFNHCYLYIVFSKGCYIIWRCNQLFKFT